MADGIPLAEVIVEPEGDGVKLPGAEDLAPGDPHAATSVEAGDSNAAYFPAFVRTSGTPLSLLPNKDPETATITVNGEDIEDFESVWVQHRWTEGYPIFRFTMAERDPVPEYWYLVQLKPGDNVQIYLGGVIAIVGIITDRQVAYDANNHQVLLVGVGWTWYAARGSVDSKTNNFDNKSIVQVAREVFAKYKVKVRVIGEVDQRPFKRLQAEPGEENWQFMERIARPKKVIMGSDQFGNILLIGDHDGATYAELEEGRNILKMQCTISKSNIWSKYVYENQSPGDNSNNMTKASEQTASAPGTASLPTDKVTPAPYPVWDVAELKKMAVSEQQWSEGTIVNAVVTVQGWFNPVTHDLWRAGSIVWVRSPMAMLNMQMKAKTVTFTQDSNSGTLTILDLWIPWYLNDKRYTADTGFPDPAKRNPQTDPTAPVIHEE